MSYTLCNNKKGGKSMSSQSRLRQSREQWKRKSSARANDNRYLRKELARVKNERDLSKKKAKEAKEKLKQLERQAKTPVVDSKVDIVLIALQLFLIARIGFRAVSRVLGVLNKYLGLTKIPCPQTIINWVTRLSITRIQHMTLMVGSHVSGAPFSNGFLWIIDTSIALGAGKILAVLALKVCHHTLSEGAPSLQQNIHCVAVSVAISWTGEAIADFLQKVIAVLGRPAGFIKDGGSDLAKAIRILSERGLSSQTIDDISHVIANLLKHEYGNHSLFAIFISACGKASQKLKQTILACLAPPKVSTKARFMNLYRLVLWADQLLKHSPVGRAANGSLIAKLRASIDQLPGCKAFISRFLRDAAPLLECQKILKVKGLSNKTSKECEALIEVIPASSPVRIGFKNWSKKHLKIAETLGVAETGLPISSDPIESLFGVAKRHGTGETKDANRIAVRLPALCGQVTKEDAQRVLEVSVAQQKEVMGSLPSLTKQRQQILPNPGCLKNIILGDIDQNLELIPMARNRSKSQIVIDISRPHIKTNGPAISLENIDINHARGRPLELTMAG